jgi:hypothetical protein
MVRVAICILSLLTIGVADAQTVEAVRVAKKRGAVDGEVYAYVGGKHRRIAKRAVGAWALEDKSGVLFTQRRGQPRDPDPSQSLVLWNAATGESRTIDEEPVPIRDVMQTKLSSGQLVFVLMMQNEESGLPAIALANPESGVFHRERLAWPERIDGDSLIIKRFAAEEVARVQGNLARAEPAATETISLQPSATLD